MQHRIFIAINLPENIKNRLSEYEAKYLELPCKWTRKENIHITLAFLGYLADEELLDVCRITEEVAMRHEPFLINLKKVIYGPPKAIPRMVWAEGEKSEELARLQKDLENSLESEKGSGYTPHITLGRLKQWEFSKIETEERPVINEDMNLSFEAKSIEIMESNLKRGGPEYIVLESFQLK